MQNLTEETLDELKDNGIALFILQNNITCNQYMQTLQNIEDEYDVHVYVADIHEESEIAEALSINSVPTLVFFKDGVPAQKLTGVKNKEIISMFLH